jgi:undecaprenyl-diphosphatase
MEFWQALILAVIEGLTEYLPVSSTGHIILGSAMMGIEGVDFVKDYTVIVQFGAILSVLVVYRERIVQALRRGPRVFFLLLLSFLPAAFFGLLFGKKIDAMLGDVAVVGWSLLLGGFVLLFLDRLATRFENPARETDGLSLPYKDGVIIGFAQCLALVPGVSRSGASIAGALALGFSRKTAAEFSFFLAVPTLTAATGYKLLKLAPHLTRDTLPLLLVGNVVSFIVGILAIKSFIGFLQKRGFFWFGIYRIVIGAVILAIVLSGHSLKM